MKDPSLETKNLIRSFCQILYNTQECTGIGMAKVALPSTPILRFIKKVSASQKLETKNFQPLTGSAAKKLRNKTSFAIYSVNIGML
jgi:hypothetical protein